MKGLDEEEADFLNLVSERQEAVLKQREAETEAVLEEYRVSLTLLNFYIIYHMLTCYVIVISYGDIDLGQHWLR